MNPFLIAATLAVHPAHGEKMTSLTQPPEVSPAKTFEPSTPAVFALANGITVWLMHRPDLPLVSLSLAINGGSGQEPAESPGLSAFTDSMILKGAGERDAIEFAKTEAVTFLRDLSLVSQILIPNIFKLNSANSPYCNCRRF